MQNRNNSSLGQFDWDHARLFLSVAKLGSLTAAAAEAKISQSTLSRQMAAFEEQLGLTLFERLGRGIQVTEAGQSLLSYLSVMGEAADQISMTVAGLADSLAGKVTISVSELDAAFRIPNLVNVLRSVAPEIQLDIVVTNAVSDLKAREADIAIRGTRPTQPDLIARKIADEQIDVFGHPDYVKQLTESELSEAQFIAFENVDQIQQVLNDHGWAMGPDNFQIRTNFQWLQLELAKSGQGLVILPTDIGETLGLEVIRPGPEEDPFMMLSVWLVSHRELRTNPRVKFVFDLIVEHVKLN